MRKMIDLTQTFIDQMPVYPGDTVPKLIKFKDFNLDGFVNYQIITSMHAGTHIDGPMHMTSSDLYLSDIDINQFGGKGCVIDVPGVKRICWKEEYTYKISQSDIVLIHTGFGKIFGTEKYVTEHPVFDISFAEKLVEMNIKLVGMDMISPDEYPYEIHHKLLSNNVLIAENLTNLDKLLFSKSFEIIALPLKFKADSSPARIIAIVNEE